MMCVLLKVATSIVNLIIVIIIIVPPLMELQNWRGDDNDDDCDVIEVLMEVATDEKVCPNDVHDM